MIEDCDLHEPQKNHLAGGPIAVRRRTNLTQGLEIHMAVTWARRMVNRGGVGGEHRSATMPPIGVTSVI
jgi:hypothetical protein